MHECKALGHVYVLTIPTLWEVVEIANSGLVDEFLVSTVQGYHPRLSRLSLRMKLSGLSAVYESDLLPSASSNSFISKFSLGRCIPQQQFNHTTPP